MSSPLQVALQLEEVVLNTMKSKLKTAKEELAAENAKMPGRHKLRTETYANIGPVFDAIAKTDMVKEKKEKKDIAKKTPKLHTDAIDALNTCVDNLDAEVKKIEEIKKNITGWEKLISDKESHIAALRRKIATEETAPSE